MTKTDHSREVWLRASPSGKRAGFVALDDGHGGAVTITILPKVWAPIAKATRSVAHPPGATTHVTVYELDYLCIASTASATGALLRHLSTVSNPGEVDLLASARRPDRERPAESHKGNPFDGLFDLVNVANRSGVRSDESDFAHGLDPAFTRVVTFQKFLSVVEPLLMRARPRYVEATEALRAPKGRVHDRSLLLAEATGVPELTVTFDDLTMDTPLLRVVKAALHVIASERVPAFLRVLAARVDVQATQFAKHLTPVATISREAAAQAAPRVWLPALDQQWQPVVDLAVEVLAGRGPTPTNDTSTTEAFVAHVFTEKFWEQTLAAVLERVFGRVSVSADKSAGPGVKAPTPWVRAHGKAIGSGTYPDFMFQSGVDVVLADAKYKRTRKIDAGDGYQLFTYSHLATLDGRASRYALLLHPAASGVTASQERWARRDDPSYPLWTVHLPYPSAEDLRSTARWHRYLDCTAAALKDLSHAWSPPSTP